MVNLVFKDRAAHDQYQVAAEHFQFIGEKKDNRHQVRVFDPAVEFVKVIPSAPFGR